jgi:zipA, C-terminal ftsZ-binding domain
MNIFLLIIIILLAVLIVVVAYNMHQENQYRQKIRSQFGHADSDALLNASHRSTRDGQTFAETGKRLRRSPVKPETPSEPTVAPSPAKPTPAPQQTHPEKPKTELPQPKPQTQPAEKPTAKAALQLTAQPIDNEISVTINAKPDFQAAEQEISVNLAPPAQPIAKPKTNPNQSELQFDRTEQQPKRETPFAQIINSVTNVAAPPAEARKPLISLASLENSDLQWFDKRFDYMSYIALYEPKELNVIPRLSGSHRFQIVGCTLDGRFQIAEPIPGVAYQAFVIGLQAISRSGLAGEEELEHFAQQSRQFAEKMNGIASTTHTGDFLEAARPLDELCARVDQTIAIHLVARSNVSGNELRHTVEKAGFMLMHDGTFAYLGSDGDPKYTIAALDGSVFTEALLSNQPYKGFSMLFDITRVPSAEEDFNEFMNIAVKLSGELGLDLVDDQVRQLSTEWLKEVRTYVGARQTEMRRVGIEPNSPLAKRVFA